MSYDPRINKRLENALHNATDRTLQMDMLLAHNREQDSTIGAIQDALKTTQNAIENINIRISFLKTMVTLCLVPLAGASILVAFDLIKNWGLMSK